MNAAYQLSRSLVYWFRKRRFFKVFTIYGHDGHTDYVTWTVWTNASYEIWLWLAILFLRRRCLKSVNDGRRRPTFTISSPVSFLFRWANNVSLRKLLQQGILEPEFYGDLVYRIRKNVGKSNFAEQFRKLINCYIYKRIGYNPYIMRQTACLVVNQIMVGSLALLFNCTAVIRGSDPMKISS